MKNATANNLIFNIDYWQRKPPNTIPPFTPPQPQLEQAGCLNNG
jgi:hypothetical protein